MATSVPLSGACVKLSWRLAHLSGTLLFDRTVNHLKRAIGFHRLKICCMARGRSSKGKRTAQRRICIAMLVDASQESRAGLILQPVAGLEEPGNDCHAEGKEAERDRQAQSDMHVGDIEKAPAEA
jgi:hypothetical protein